MIEYQQTAPGAPRFDRKRIELTLHEVDVRMGGTSDGEHGRRPVDAEHVEPMIGQERCHPARSATASATRPAGLLLDQLDEPPRAARSTACSVAEPISAPANFRRSPQPLVDGPSRRNVVFPGHGARIGDGQSLVWGRTDDPPFTSVSRPATCGREHSLPYAELPATRTSSSCASARLLWGRPGMRSGFRSPGGACRRVRPTCRVTSRSAPCPGRRSRSTCHSPSGLSGS